MNLHPFENLHDDAWKDGLFMNVTVDGLIFNGVKPGIVKFLVEEPIDDEKTVKKRIKAAIMENVKYVDVQVGAKEYHVRCAHADMAKTLSKAKILGQATILDGEDEQKYWEKIKKDRDAKLSGKVKVKSGAKRARGQDRLTKKIQMMNQTDNKHTYFDDD